MVGLGGFEPTNDGVKVRCLTAWLYPYKKMVEGSGFEPPTPALEERCSIPAELREFNIVWGYQPHTSSVLLVAIR